MTARNEIRLTLEDIEHLPDIAVVYGYAVDDGRLVSAVVDLCPATELARQMLIDGEQPVIRLHASQLIHPETAA